MAGRIFKGTIHGCHATWMGNVYEEPHSCAAFRNRDFVCISHNDTSQMLNMGLFRQGICGNSLCHKENSQLVVRREILKYTSGNDFLSYLIYVKPKRRGKMKFNDFTMESSVGDGKRNSE